MFYVLKRKSNEWCPRLRCGQSFKHVEGDTMEEAVENVKAQIRSDHGDPDDTHGYIKEACEVDSITIFQVSKEHYLALAVLFFLQSF